MTYATMHIASLLIAFTLGLPSRNLPQIETFGASGQVIFNGQSLEGVEIVFERVSSLGPTPNSVRTGVDGQWRQSGFLAGPVYRAIPKKQGFVFVPVNREFSAKTKGSLSFEASASPGAKPKPPSITEVPRPGTTGTLSVSFSASGRVTTPDGKGVPGVKILFTLVSGSGNTPGEVETDAQGKWIQVGFRNDSVYQIRPQRLQGDIFTSQTLTLRFPSGVVNVSDQNFQIAIGNFVASGRVTTQGGRVVSGVTLVVPSGSGQARTALTDAQGRWTVNLQNNPGTFRVTPGLENFTFNPASRDFTNRSATELDFKLPDTFSIAGELKGDAQGIAPPVPNATVTFELLSGTGARPASVRSDGAGAFRQTGFTTGSVYRVKVVNSSGRVCGAIEVKGERSGGRINCL